MSKLVAFLCLVCLLLTALWVGLLVADMTSAGPLETFEQAVAMTVSGRSLSRVRNSTPGT